MASTKTPTSTSNGTGRLPSTRERRPALAALAVLLIVGGAVASAWLAMQAGHRAEFVQVSSDVAQGQQISEGDLTSVELPEDFDDGVSWDDREDLVGQYAAMSLAPGMIMTDAMTVDEDDTESQRLQFSLPIRASMAPDLTEGMSVAVYTGGLQGQAIDGTVVGEPVGSDGDLGSSDAYALVSVPNACGDEVAAAQNEDRVEVAIRGAAIGEDTGASPC